MSFSAFTSIRNEYSGWSYTIVEAQITALSLIVALRLLRYPST